MAEQGELIPLSAEELKARGPMLARMTLELESMKADHKEEKAKMTADEKAASPACTSRGV